jgi:hypothetical protein
MTATQSGPVSASALSSGTLGARPPVAKTFRGSDPDTVAAATISSDTRPSARHERGSTGTEHLSVRVSRSLRSVTT